MADRVVEKERLILIKETKQELWRNQRQNKGKAEKPREDSKQNKEEELNRKLAKIEEKVRRYEEEIVIAREAAKTRQEKLEKKRRKEKHWELLRWVVKFIEENTQQWEENKQKRKKHLEEVEREEE